MKKIYGAFIITMLLFAAGCKQDEVIVPSTLQNNNLLGKWYLKELEIVPANDPASSSSFTDYTSNDYFEFKAGNKATYSSTLYATVFEGYYSANSATTPQALSFKSGDLLIKYYIESIDPTNQMVLYDTVESAAAGIPTTILYRYTYSRIP